MRSILVKRRTPRPRSLCVMCDQFVGANYPHLLRSQLLRSSLQMSRPASRKSSNGIMNHWGFSDGSARSGERTLRGNS